MGTFLALYKTLHADVWCRLSPLAGSHSWAVSLQMPREAKSSSNTAESAAPHERQAP